MMRRGGTLKPPPKPPVALIVVSDREEICNIYAERRNLNKSGCCFATSPEQVVGLKTDIPVVITNSCEPLDEEFMTIIKQIFKDISIDLF